MQQQDKRQEHGNRNQRQQQFHKYFETKNKNKTHEKNRIEREYG